MAALLREYKCLAHGAFDAYTNADQIPKCPKGCGTSMVMRAFRTAPGTVSKKTRFMDQTLAGVARDFGMSDMNNDGGRGAARLPVKMPGADGLEQFVQNRLGLDQTYKVGGLGVQGGWGHVAPGHAYDAAAKTVMDDGRTGAGAIGTLTNLGALSAGSGFAPTGKGAALVVGDNVAATLPKPEAKVVASYDIPILRDAL